MIVSAKPKLEFESFYSKTSQISNPWDGAIFFRNGREALISALKELYIPTQSKILIPAYICNSIPETLLRYGYEPIFLDVTTELNFSKNKLKEIINSQEIKAVILVDYFGFITKMNIQQSKIIKELGVNVIVDRCHSSLSSMEELFSSNSVDAVIYSIRKTLPVRDGGALILNTNNRVNYSSNSNGMHKDLWFIISRYIERFICTIGFPNIYADWITHLRIKLDGKYRKYREIKNDTHKNISEIERGKSWLLKNQLSDVNYLGDIARKRRENYFKYKKYLKQTGISLLFSEIGSNDVPQVVPIIDTKGSLTKFLREVGIGAYQWPGNEIPKQVSDSPSLYPNSIDLNTKVVCLPVHQSLNSNMILNVISNIERWKEV